VDLDDRNNKGMTVIMLLFYFRWLCRFVCTLSLVLLVLVQATAGSENCLF
jgi:hypothetical protein